MKTNAIIRIVLFSIAILVLLGILGAVLGVHLYMFRSSQGNHEEVTHIPEKIETSDLSTAEAGRIRELEIDWVSGNITIAASADTDVICVSETKPQKDSQKMVCTEQGDTLRIEFCRDTELWSIHNSIEKDLTILVPLDWNCTSVEIHTASAEVLIQNMSIRELDFEGASGNCRIENCNIGSFDVDAASGNVDFCGTLNTLDYDSASGDCILILTNCPKSLELDGMSGKLDLTLPEDCGFTAEVQGLSTDFSSEFETTSRNHSHIYGNGACKISLESMSGSIIIRKGSGICHDNHN